MPIALPACNTGIFEDRKLILGERNAAQEYRRSSLGRLRHEALKLGIPYERPTVLFYCVYCTETKISC